MNGPLPAVGLIGGIAIVVACAACSSQNHSGRSDCGRAAADIAAADRRIQQLEQELGRASATNPVVSPGSAAEALFPPDAKPGECYARVLIPARFRNVVQRTLVRAEVEETEFVEPVYKLVEQQVLVEEAATRPVIQPAQYVTEKHRIVVTPATTRIIEVPATYKTVTERIVDKPAHTAWKRGSAAMQTGKVLAEQASGTGEVMCLVEVAATYRSITRQVVDEPARTYEEVVPATYKEVERRVLKSPATSTSEVVPARYETVSVRELVKPGEQRRIVIPAEYETVQYREKVADEILRWELVLCDVNATPEIIQKLQAALEQAGFDPGQRDGVLNDLTLRAVIAFARDRGLPAGDNFVSLAVMKALGIDQ